MEEEASVGLRGDMTRGNITSHIVTFAIPIIIGNIFQQLYNTMDAMIVGRMLGGDAFASVSVANPIMSVVLFFLVGLCMGVSVLISQKFGAKRYDEVKNQLSTALIAGVIFTLCAAAVCVFFSGAMLTMANTPPEIFDETNKYLRIIFIGLIFSFLYNYYASALRAIGISRAVLVFLVISFGVNIVLDIVFIRYSPLGVSGAAAATVIAQGLSALLCIAYVYRCVPMLALKRGEFTFHRDILLTTVAFSWAAALQQTVLYLGRLMIQGTVNSYGMGMINGYNAAIRLEAFVMAVIDGTAAAVAAYAGQNLGAEKYGRLKKGLWRTVVLNWSFCIVCTAAFLIMPDQLVGMYLKNADAEVIHIGTTYIRTMAVFYMLCCVMSAMQGFFRGAGKLKVTMVATFSQIVVRVAFTVILMPYLGVTGICISVILGWIMIFLYDGLQYVKFFKQLRDKVAIGGAK